MKVSQLKCSICNNSIEINKIKRHLFKAHLDVDFDILVQTFINFRIKGFNENELRLIEKRWKYSKIKTDKTNIYLLKIKVFHFEQSISILFKTPNINRIEHEYYKLLSFIDTLNESISINSALKIEIDRNIEKLNKIYTSRLTKQDYYLKTVECTFCNNRIFKTSINDHILKSHFREKSKAIESALIYYKQELTDIQHVYLDDIKNLERNILEQEINNHINDRYYSIEKEIMSLSGVEYAELLDSKVESIKLHLFHLLNYIKYGELEIKKNNSLLEQVQNLNISLPSKEKFINDYCKKIYITWDDITFEKNKICISANKEFVHPIPLEGSLSILNEIKVEYFRRVYHSDKFKLIIKNGYVRHDLSSGIDRIKERISEHIQGLITVKKERIDGQASIFTRSSGKSEIIEYIHKQTLKNSFLKYPATLLNENDNVIALIENNNGMEEESLLFIFIRGKYAFLLWENINSKRAAYVFCFDVNTLKFNTSKIVQLINTHAEHKRENLFRGVDIYKVYNINCIRYKSIVHELQQDYINDLDKILNFSI